MKNSTWVSGFVALVASTLALPAASLNIGDAAPPLKVSQWVQGEPVTSFDSNHVYMVEFWATWCGPCKASIPHVNQLQLKFKDKGLIVIGQDVWEKDTSKVPGFIKQMGENMAYRVALDETNSVFTNGVMAKTWMEDSGSKGIPAAFLVNKSGKIAWIGHPMNLKDETLEQVIAGTYDIEKAAEDRKKEIKADEEREAAFKEYNENLRKKEWTKAEAALDKLESVLPEEQRAQASFLRVRLYLEKSDFKQAEEFALKAGQSATNASIPGILAAVLSSQTNKEVKLDTALALANRANQLSDNKNPSFLELAAKIHYKQGNTNKAVELMTAAVDLAQGKFKTNLQTTLENYKAGKVK